MVQLWLLDNHGLIGGTELTLKITDIIICDIKNQDSHNLVAGGIEQLNIFYNKK